MTEEDLTLRLLASLAEMAPADYGSPDGTDTLTLELGELTRLKLAAISRHVSITSSTINTFAIRGLPSR